MSIMRKALIPLLSILFLLGKVGCAGQGAQNTGAIAGSQEETSSYMPNKLTSGLLSAKAVKMLNQKWSI
ncbi:hypothetical protein ACFVQB_19440 [Paenibacillus sp. NPDC057886]|uniref:hypothetical protein n=1 Tax=Paenibacillus sp. NPDC057886 TaxID=3346270 RepID=UPI0036B7767E